jgi:hypothetical protein
MATVRRTLDKTVARLPAVRAHLRALADEVLAAAQARAAAHTDSGIYARSLRVARGRIDARVESRDPRAESKEFGHTDQRTGRPVPGIHALGGAATDVAARHH